MSTANDTLSIHDVLTGCTCLDCNAAECLTLASDGEALVARCGECGEEFTADAIREKVRYLAALATIMDKIEQIAV